MPATAEEQTLKGRLVVNQPTGSSTALPSFAGHTFNANKYSGVAVFEDGRVALKQYIESSDDTEACFCMDHCGSRPSVRSAPNV
jgi:hypothetical protein